MVYFGAMSEPSQLQNPTLVNHGHLTHKKQQISYIPKAQEQKNLFLSQWHSLSLFEHCYNLLKSFGVLA